MADDPDTQAEIARLEAKRDASLRLGSGYADRVRMIEAKLEKLRQ